VRQWEKQTGRFWADLSPEEREAANSEIALNNSAAKK
jgi:hypothetical protein